jgi:dihydrofolate reductase
MLRVHNFTVSLDGFAAGPRQSPENPLGERGLQLHDWIFRGWWGEDPPFGHDVFVLTRHSRADLTMRNGTTFHFVDAAPRAVLAMATRAAGGQDVVLGGGAATMRQFLAEGLVDEMHLAIAPVLLGDGERLFDRLPLAAHGYSCSELTCSAGIAHVRITRTPSTDE